MRSASAGAGAFGTYYYVMKISISISMYSVSGDTTFQMNFLNRSPAEAYIHSSAKIITV
jgi:hypothetical protein